MAPIAKKPLTPVMQRALTAHTTHKLAVHRQRIVQQQKQNIQAQIRDHFQNVAPNNADDEDDRSFMGAKKRREEAELKALEAHEMRLELKRRAIIAALKSGRLKLPQRRT